MPGPALSALGRRDQRGMNKGDSILERLVELDRKACAMVEEAQEALEDTLANTERDMERFREEYTKKAVQRIGVVRDEEGKASQAELEDITRRYHSLMEGLEQTYQERHTQWEEEIFQRCIEK